MWVGSTCIIANTIVGFIRGPLGNFKLFQIPKSRYTYPLAINNAVHKIVGYYAF